LKDTRTAETPPSRKFIDTVEELRDSLIAELKEAEMFLESLGNPLGGLSVKDATRLTSYSQDSVFRTSVDNFAQAQSKVDSLNYSIRMLHNRSALHRHHCVSESYDDNSFLPPHGKLYASFEERVVDLFDRSVALHLKLKEKQLNNEKALNLVFQSYAMSQRIDELVAYALEKNIDLTHFHDRTGKLRHLQEVLLENQEPSSLFSESEDVIATAEKGEIDTNAVKIMGNVTDAGGDESKEDWIGKPTKTNVLSDSTLSMSDFLSRPIVFNINLPTNTDLMNYYSVWSLFTSDPTVRAKLRNYGFLRGNLCARVNVSGTPFHYGKILLAYVPYSWTINDVVQVYAANPALNPLLLKWLVQTPGSVVLDVRDNQPVDMFFPYVSPQAAGRLFNNSNVALPALTPFDDFKDMGTLLVYSLNRVGSVAPTPTNVNIQILVWMEDVELGVATGTVSTITTEAGDERKTGPIEAIASNALKLSVVAEKIPIIGPYAKASSIVLVGIQKLAALFGWSYPTMNTAPNRMKNEPFQNAAQVIGHDTGQRISLDPRQELTIDPRIVGVDEDELSFSYLASKHSLLDTASWPSGTAPMTSPIWYAAVHPKAAVPYQGTTYKTYQPTTLDYIVTPFQYWRGDLIYTFEIVCSNFHRGKIGVYYEPNTSQQVLIDTNPDMNKRFMKIIDIQQTRTFEICVNWATSKNWLLNTTTGNGMVGTSLINPSSFWGIANGYIALIPFSYLESPDNSSIKINVYVHSDNMLVNCLIGNLPTNRLLGQCLTSEAGLPGDEEVTCFELNPSGASTDGITLEHFGEIPLSFRPLIKRFTTTNIASYGADSSPQKVVSYTGLVIPPLIPSMTSSSTAYPPSLLSYLRYAFLGFRGGLRKRFRFTNINPNMEASQVKVQFNPPSYTSYIPYTNVYTTPGVGTSNLIGTLTFVPQTNGGIEFEIPYYSNNYFQWSCSADPFNNANSNLESYGIRNYTITYDTGSTNAFSAVEETAAGEDFTFLRFIACPPYAQVT